MTIKRKIYKLELELLKFAKKHNLRCIQYNYATEVYLNENLLTYDTEDEISFATFRSDFRRISFETGLYIDIDIENNGLSIEYTAGATEITKVSQFHKLEKTYEKLMDKLLFLNKLVKDHEIDIRKNELEKDFKLKK